MSYDSTKQAIEDRANEIASELGPTQVIGWNEKEKALHLEIDAEILRFNTLIAVKYAELSAEEKLNALSKLTEKVLPGLLEVVHLLKSL